MLFLFFFSLFFFFFNDTATTEIYTLSLHDARPICSPTPRYLASSQGGWPCAASASFAPAIVRRCDDRQHSSATIVANRNSPPSNRAAVNGLYRSASAI